MRHAAEGKRAAGERDRVGQSRGHDVVVIEGATGKYQRGRVARSGSAERPSVRELERTASDRERRGVTGIEARVGRGREGHLTGAAQVHVSHAQQRAAEGQHAGGRGHVPGLICAQPKIGSERDDRRPGALHLDAVGRDLRSDLESVGGDGARIDCDGRRRRGTRLEDQFIDLIVLLEGSDEGRGGDPIPSEDDIRAGAGKAERRPGAVLVQGPVVEVAIPGQVRRATPIKSSGDERAGGERDGGVRHSPGHAREATGRATLDDVPCSKGRQAAIHQAQQRVGRAARQTCVRHVDRDRVG